MNYRDILAATCMCQVQQERERDLREMNLIVTSYEVCRDSRTLDLRNAKLRSCVINIINSNNILVVKYGMQVDYHPTPS